MKKDNNFKKALNELLSLDRDDSDQVFENEERAAAVPERIDSERAQMDEALKRQIAEAVVMEPPAPPEEEQEIPQTFSKSEKKVYEAVITPDVIINGDIVAGSNLKIFGQVFGNVACEGTIELAGSVEGDVSANRLRFLAGGIQGNVSVMEDMMAEKETQIKGDIKAGSAVFSGSVWGELTVQDNLELRETASVVGNVKALGISVRNGSRIKGMFDIGGRLREEEVESEG